MLIDTVRQTIRTHELIRPGDHIVLGLSGGPDSLCLFHALLRLSREWKLTIHPVHVNHGFRPGAAEEDQAFVEEICAKAGTPCRSFVVDCKSLAEELSLTPEEAGRKARYDAFLQVAREAGAAASIAVAQNANDQAETILHRIIRGTGPDGLSGIAYKRYEREVPVIRPLLDVPRKEIEDYCRENGLDPVTDHTNMEPVYTRNRIRLEILPFLEKYNGNIAGSLSRLARIASADREYLRQETEKALDRIRLKDGEGSDRGASVLLDREGLAALPEALRRRVVMTAFEEIGLDQDITEERLEAADRIILKKQAPKTVEFPHGYRLTSARGRVRFHR